MELKVTPHTRISLEARDAVWIASMLLGFGVLYGALRSDINAMRADVGDIKSTVRVIDDRLWQHMATKPAVLNLAPCARDITQVRL